MLNYSEFLQQRVKRISRTCHQLISDHLAITSKTCNSMEERVSLRGLGLFFEFRGREKEGTFNKRVHKLIDDLKACPESAER